MKIVSQLIVQRMYLNIFREDKIISGMSMFSGRFQSITILFVLLLFGSLGALVLAHNNSTTQQEYSFSQVKNTITTTTAKVISTVSIQNSLRPAIAVDANDNIHTVWEDTTNYASAGNDVDILYRMWNATTLTWETTGVLSSESGGNSGEPEIAADELGNIHLAWRDVSNILSSGGDWDIFYKIYNATTHTWTTTEIASTESGANVVWLDLFAKNGIAYITWQDASNMVSDGIDQDIFFKQRFPNGTWTPVELVSSESTGHSRFPEIFVDNNLNIHITWGDSTDLSSGTDEDIFYKKKDSVTGIWSTTEVISTESTFTAWRSRVVVDDTQNIHLVWHDDMDNLLSSGLDRDIFYKVWNASLGSWSSLVLVSSESTSDSHVPELLIDNKNNLHFVWFDSTDISSNGVDQDVFYKVYYSAANAWSNVEVVSKDSSGDSWRSAAAFDSQYKIHIVWMDRSVDYGGSGLDFDILYSMIYDPDLIAELSVLSAPNDKIYQINTTGHELTWVLQDDNVSSPFYSITQNGTDIQNGSWSSEAAITTNIDGLTLGVYEYRLNATDGLGNYVQNLVIVTVVEELDTAFDFGDFIINMVFGVLIAASVVMLSMTFSGRRKK